MLNKQFYKDQLEDLLITGQTHVICSFKKEHLKGCSDYCEYEGSGGCYTCQEAFKNWLNEEHQESIKITLFEKLALMLLLQEGYDWIAKDKDGSIYGYVDIPFKDDYFWRVNGGGGYIDLELFNVLFNFIQWTDEEPTHLQTLLDNCEVLEDD